jgi:hypothetical protein
MPAPVVYDYPVRRPGFISSATWNGTFSDSSMSLNLHYTDATGTPTQLSLFTLGETNAVLCLPNSKTIADISDDLIIAHVRMMGMITGVTPGSTEWSEAVIGSGVLDAKNFQTPVGDVKVTEVTLVSDVVIDIEVQKVSGGAKRTVRTSFSELSTYSFAPSTQLLVVAGSVRKQFPSGYFHDPANSVRLTQAKMDDIAAYVASLQPWI